MEDINKKDEKQKKREKENHLQIMVFKLVALLIIVIGVLLGIKICVIDAPREAGVAVVSTLDGTAKVLTKYIGPKEAFDATIGPIVAEQRFRRLQFFQRDQVCLFRIVRYRGKDKDKENHYHVHDHVEFYKKESDKKDINNLIFLKQYCEWQAKGTYEFNFYVDMSDLSKWNHKWDPEKFTLTLYPPDIEANTPAELEPLVYTCVADSISIDQRFTKTQLEKKIPDLKNKLEPVHKTSFL